MHITFCCFKYEEIQANVWSYSLSTKYKRFETYIYVLSMANTSKHKEAANCTYRGLQRHFFWFEPSVGASI